MATKLGSMVTYLAGFLLYIKSHDPLIKWSCEIKFDKHVSDLCDKVSKKINALCRVTGYMSLEKHRIVMKTFVESQFIVINIIAL